MNPYTLLDPPYLDHVYSATVAEVDQWIAKLRKMNPKDEGVQTALRLARAFRKSVAVTRTVRRRVRAKRASA